MSYIFKLVRIYLYILQQEARINVFFSPGTSKRTLIQSKGENYTDFQFYFFSECSIIVSSFDISIRQDYQYYCYRWSPNDDNIDIGILKNRCISAHEGIAGTFFSSRVSDTQRDGEEVTDRARFPSLQMLHGALLTPVAEPRAFHAP